MLTNFSRLTTSLGAHWAMSSHLGGLSSSVRNTWRKSTSALGWDLLFLALNTSTKSFLLMLAIFSQTVHNI